MNDKVNVRMCCYCRERFSKANLLRLVIDENKIYVDNKKERKGRGFYLCSVKCFDAAIKRKMFERMKTTVDEEQYSFIKEMLENRQ